MNKKIDCPFNIGDSVIFKPSERTLGLYHNIEKHGLIPGEIYKITEISEGTYLKFEEGGGWPWNEFELA